MGNIKPKIKRRNPNNLDELMQIALKEWNGIKKPSIELTHLEFVKRVKKIIEIEGSQLETYHLKQIKNEIREEYNELYKKEEKEEGKDQKKRKIKNEGHL